MSGGDGAATEGGAGGTGVGISGAGGALANQAGAGAQVGGNTATAGTAGTAGSSATLCPVESKVGAPSLSTDCAITVRPIDPALTCASADCAITKALDLTCAFLPGKPLLSATADGAEVMVATGNGEKYQALARLMTVAVANSRVQDVPVLTDSSNYFSILDSALSANSSGAKWLFAGETPGITALHGTDAGWTRSTVAFSSDSNKDARLTAAVMVDDRLGYLTYYLGDVWTPYLATWDGSCWTDQLIGEPHVMTMAIQTDAQKRPWVAWLSVEYPSDGGSSANSLLYVRGPNGDTQKLDVTAESLTDSDHLRLLPGGLDGSAAFPTVAARFSDGIRLLSKNAPTDPAWRSLTLAESAAAFSGSGDCPSELPSLHYGNHCDGMTSCTLLVSGVGAGFDLARTQSGAVFAAWVAYSSQGTYALQETSDGGELPQSYCGLTETSGGGTADLVVARLTDSEPILTHFHFVMSGAVRYLSDDVAMVARGDTLVVAAHLSGETVPTLTYLEIDSTLLP
jgi:hypothetical protein